VSDRRWRTIAPGVRQRDVTLEVLTPGARVGGVVTRGVVSVVQVRWHGSHAVTLTYQDETGRSDHRLLYRDHERSLWLEEASGRTPSTATRHCSGSPPGRCGSGWPPGSIRCWRSPPATSTRCRTRSRRCTATWCRARRWVSSWPRTRAPVRPSPRLVESLYRGYPSGSLLFWRTLQTPETRAVAAEAPTATPVVPPLAPAAGGQPQPVVPVDSHTESVRRLEQRRVNIPGEGEPTRHLWKDIGSRGQHVRAGRPGHSHPRRAGGHRPRGGHRDRPVVQPVRRRAAAAQRRRTGTDPHPNSVAGTDGASAGTRSAQPCSSL
jgi:hypothetical protein